MLCAIDPAMIRTMLLHRSAWFVPLPRTRAAQSLPRFPLLAALMALLLTACSASLPRDGGAASSGEPVSEVRRMIVLEALGQIGRPYRYGGTSPDGFDCSGLTQYVYRQAGVAIPRSTKEQHVAGQVISLRDAEPGDLLFYRFSGGGKVDHVAVFLGEGKAVHAPARNRTVIVAQVSDPAWTRRFVDVVRILEP